MFYADRPDPLDSNRINCAAHMDAFIGNPPFAGKNALSEIYSARYLDWLPALHEGAHGNADYSAHFLLRADELLGKHGTMGFIATGTIAQGDTRNTGLRTLLSRGLVIYEATTRVPWTGGPNVAVAVIHIAKGIAAQALSVRLDGAPVLSINSHLRAGGEVPDPVKLSTNAGLVFQGSVVLGMGFTLSPARRDELISRSPSNAERIFPYLGGQEVVSSPTQSFDRYVIDFGQMPLAEVARWPELLSIVRATVKPERDGNKREHYRLNWWLFGERRPGLYDAIMGLGRCLVTLRVQKHLALCFQDTKQVFANTVYVFPLQHMTAFAELQSRIHETWTRFLSSTLEDRAATARLNYSASECFDTFAFPRIEPRAVLPALEDIGQRLYDTRAKYMVDENVGLTVAYNRLKDPGCDEPRILELRKLHEEVDRRVLDAYAEGDPVGRWREVEVPPFCSISAEDEKAVAAFEESVVDRLFVLNAKRADEERLKGLAVSGSKPKKRAATSQTRTQKKARGKTAEDQLILASSDPDAES